jgi:tripartite-type tricarboxylate transporter receptor subunit TctC
MSCILRFVTAVLILVAGAASVPVHAQTYPSKPMRLILPFPPGGPTDIVGRLTGQKLSEQIAQSVIADSRPGASGNIGLELASKALPDGYTIVLSSPVISLSPHLYTKLNYDPQKDLASRSACGTEYSHPPRHRARSSIA